MAGKGFPCDSCPGVIMQHFTMDGRRWIYKCPQCGAMRYKPKSGPKRQKELVLTSIPLNELQIQRRYIEECRAQARHWPELSLIHSVPNGAFVPPGERGKLVGSGMLRAVPDVFLPAARGPFHGLYIEFKIPGEEPRPDQVLMHKALRAQSYDVQVYDEWRGAYNYTLQYLAQDENKA